VTPFFSVVIPTYNRGASIGRAIQSVLAQSCQDFEILVVDDGSSDGTGGLVAGIPDPRIRYIWQKNRGGGAARNAGIDAASGQFVALLDSDDEFLPGHLERMENLLKASDITVGYARIVVNRGNGRTLMKPPRAIFPGEHMATYLLCDRGFVPTITTVVERRMAQRVRYSEQLSFGQDTDFAIRLFLGGCRFSMIEAPGAIWHDLQDPKRSSANRKGTQLGPWIERLRPLIPSRAYHGCRGWAIAKGVAAQNKRKALTLYLAAVVRRCYSPRLAVTIFLQIFLSDEFYRLFADRVIGLLPLLKSSGFQPTPTAVGNSTEAA
jgi:glycosyltransferase involved in cell wall biosynthesis